MAEADAIWLDGAVGETRCVWIRAGRPAALRSLRWSEAGQRARLGEIYGARVLRLDRPRRGAFLDLGLKEEQGFLPLDSQNRAHTIGGAAIAVQEGQLLLLEITREGARTKGPIGTPLLGQKAEKVGRLGPNDEDAALLAAPPATSDMRARIDGVFDEALARQIPIPGGGLLIIEPTAALTAIDVDAGGRSGAGDAERFVRDLNIAAAQEAMRQLQLRNQGGLCVIDFVSMRRQDSRRDVEAALREAAKSDAWGCQLAPMSRFGLIELSRPQRQRPISEIALAPDGRLSQESRALEVLRALEREASASRGRPVAARIHPEIAKWLQSSAIGWRDALTRRIGARFTIESDPEMDVARLDVRWV